VQRQARCGFNSCPIQWKLIQIRNVPAFAVSTRLKLPSGWLYRLRAKAQRRRLSSSLSVRAKGAIWRAACMPTGWRSAPVRRTRGVGPKTGLRRVPSLTGRGFGRHAGDWIAIGSPETSPAESCWGPAHSGRAAIAGEVVGRWCLLRIARSCLSRDTSWTISSTASPNSRTGNIGCWLPGSNDSSSCPIWDTTRTALYLFRSQKAVGKKQLWGSHPGCSRLSDGFPAWGICPPSRRGRSTSRQGNSSYGMLG
jgi:hypothetical protein